MTIAISAVIAPSRWLRISALSTCMLALFISLLVAIGFVGNLSIFSKYFVGVGCLFFATFGVHSALRPKKIYRIDISGIGQIRMTLVESATLFKEVSVLGAKNTGQFNGKFVHLMENSTLWTGLLLLRLSSEDGCITLVPVLPDSVSPKVFRRVLVACSWISARNVSADGSIS